MSHDWQRLGVTTLVDPAIFQRRCARCGAVEHRQYADQIREMDEAYKVRKPDGFVYADRVWYSLEWPPKGERIETEPPCKQEGA